MKEWIKERIEENKELFSIKELELINNNIDTMEKIYFLAIVNIYKV